MYKNGTKNVETLYNTLPSHNVLANVLRNSRSNNTDCEVRVSRESFRSVLSQTGVKVTNSMELVFKRVC